MCTTIWLVSPTRPSRHAGVLLLMLVEQGRIASSDLTVIAITGNGLKTQEAIQLAPPVVIEPRIKQFEQAIKLKRPKILYISEDPAGSEVNLLDAFKKAERIAGRTIGVVQSYRSCTAQALACRRICADPGGCPGTCAEPGTSSHQRGEAIDVTTSSLR